MQGITFAGEQTKGKKILVEVVNFLVAAICGLTFGFTALGFFISNLPGVVGSRDFVVYWATGQQLAHHANPYDKVELLRIERAAGLADRYGPMYMRNPPPTLLLAYPLGFMGLRIASAVWSLALLLCLVGSVYLLWQMHGKPSGHRHWLGYTFGPAMVCLLNGQTSLFPLLGLVVFLRLHRTHPLLAGLSLWLCTLKPHLFVPFGLVLLVWIVVTKSYRIALGASFAVACSFAISYHLAPASWNQYREMVRVSGMQNEYIPCLSVLLRIWFNKGAVWLQYVLAVVASIWALIYYWIRRAIWDWRTHGSLLMLVSIVAAPYSWLFDQCLAIPAILQGAYFTKIRNLAILVAVITALVETAMLCNIWKPSAVYLWTLWAAPAWLVWYLLAIDSANWVDGWPNWRVLSALRRKREEEKLPVESGVS